MILYGEEAATIGGGFQNTNGGQAATVAGGYVNMASAFAATVGGGQGNLASGNFAVATGYYNSATNAGGVVAGGGNNMAGGTNASILGGSSNNAAGVGSAIGGGYNNMVTGNYGTVPGGSNNIATTEAFAAGTMADATNQGTFVWADSQGTPFGSTGNNQFLVRAQGGVGINTTNPVGALTVDTSGAGAVTIRNENDLVPGLVATSPNSYSGYLRFRNVLEIFPNDAQTSSGYLDVRSASGATTITLDGSTGDVTGNNFAGNGANLTALNATQLTSGAVPSAQLSGTYSSAVTLNNAGNSFTGNGANLTALNATQLTSGTVPSARLSGTYSSAVTLNNAGNSFTGNGGGLTNVNAQSLNGLNGTNYWQLGGNNVASGQFIGSTNSQALELWVKGTRALRLEPGPLNEPSGTPEGTPNVIGGSPDNFVAGGKAGATIAGGGATNYGGSRWTNSVSADFGTVGGGAVNTIGGEFAVIAGGYGNTNNGYVSTVAGGYGNYVSGGEATVCGGLFNVAGGDYSFAAGQQAQALNEGAFVWADSQNAAFASTGNDQFLIRAQGGVGINVSNPGTAALSLAGSNSGVGNAFNFPTVLFENTSTNANNGPALRVVNASGSNYYGALCVSANVATGINSGCIATFGNAGAFVAQITNDGTIYSKGVVLTSDRNAKENFAELDRKEVLAKIVAMPVTEWNYKDDTADKKHIGPVAQDFEAAFGLNGADEKHISVVDESGVALAAIQGLNEKVEEKDAEIQKLKDRNNLLERRLDELEAAVKTIVERKAQGGS